MRRLWMHPPHPWIRHCIISPMEQKWRPLHEPIYSMDLVCVLDELEDAAGTPTVPNTITMRVRSMLSLQCSLQSASGEYYVEWSKDGVQLSQSHKYIFITDSTASSLSVSNTGTILFLFRIILDYLF